MATRRLKGREFQQSARLPDAYDLIVEGFRSIVRICCARVTTMLSKTRLIAAMIFGKTFMS